MLFLFQFPAKQFKSCRYKVETHALRDLAEHDFQYFIFKFDDGACLGVNQVIMVAVVRFFIPGTVAAKIAPEKNTFFFKQPDGAVDGCNGNAWVDRKGATIEFLHIRVVIGFRQDMGNNAALISQFKSLVTAQISNG